MKDCKKCKESKHENEFHKDKRTKDGLYNWCKECKNEYDKVYRQSDKVQSYQHSQEYKQKKIDYINKNFLERKIAMKKARWKNINRKEEFTITVDDLETVEYCPLLGVKLDYKVGSKDYWNGASIDRIDNDLGYIPGNVWILSRLANTMKNKASKEELITFSENILKLFKNT